MVLQKDLVPSWHSAGTLWHLSWLYFSDCTGPPGYVDEIVYETEEKTRTSSNWETILHAVGYT